jgi:hypothetical protein
MVLFAALVSFLYIRKPYRGIMNKTYFIKGKYANAKFGMADNFAFLGNMRFLQAPVEQTPSTNS